MNLGARLSFKPSLGSISLLFLFLPHQAIGQRVLNWIDLPIRFPDVYCSRNTNDILSDHRGVLWIANNGGLFVYDGAQCKLFSNHGTSSEISDAVYQLAEDDKGRLWAATQQGLVILNARRDSYVLPGETGLPDSILNAPNVNICRGIKHEIFILAHQHIYLFSNGRLKKWGNCSEVSRSIKERPFIFFSRKTDQIYLFAPGEQFEIIEKDGRGATYLWKFYEQPQRIKDLKPASLLLTLTDAFADSVSVFYACEHNSIAQLNFNARKGIFTHTFPKSLLPGITFSEIFSRFIQQYRPDLTMEQIGRIKVFRLSEDLYALSFYEGVLLLRLQKNQFNYFAQSTGERIRAIQEDAYGHLIFGTYTGTKYFRPPNGPVQKLGTEYLHAWCIEPINSIPSSFLMQGEDLYNTLYFLQSDKTRVRITREIKDLDGNGLQSFNSCMARDSILNGFWYLTNEKHLSFYDISSGRNIKFSATLTGIGERAMLKKDYYLWIGGLNGLKKIMPDLSQRAVQDLSQSIPENIRKLNINALYTDRYNNLWIGVNAKGLFKYNLNTGKIEQFTTDDGLAENSVYSILAEQDDHILWLGTGNGLSRFDTQKRWFDNYYMEDGLSNNEFNTASVFKGRAGVFYMGGQNGINYFYPHDFTTQHQALQQYAIIHLSGHKAFQKKRRQWMLGPGDSLEIDPAVQLIEIGFRTNDFFHATKLLYRYRIAGIFDEWQYLNVADKALFSSLPLGAYSLEVQVKSFRGMWSPTAVYHLHILPPWYKTWWFRTLLTVSIFSLLYGLYRLRIQYLRSEFDMRQQISRDLHDDLGSRIFLLRSLSHQITNPLLGQQERDSTIRKLEHISQEMFKSMRDFIWAFDPQRDEVKDLLDRMDDFAENYLSPIIEQVEISRPAMTQNPKINPRFKYHLMNIYQELLTNMVKHTFCTKINILLTYQGDAIQIRIENQHQGYRNNHEHTENDATTGQGMSSIRHRIKELNGKMNWQENDGTKQTAALHIPV